jgi:VanZ family protein
MTRRLSLPFARTVKRNPILFARVLAWSLAGAILVLSVVPPFLRPNTGLPHDMEHFGIFCATGIAFGLSYHRNNLLLPPLLVIFAAGIELLQLAVPGRHARFLDFIVDALAICIGVMIALMARKVFVNFE